MTIDEALTELRGSERCFLAWNWKTGELLRAKALPPEYESNERRACYAGLPDLGLDLVSRFMSTVTVTRSFLEAMENEYQRFAIRMTALENLARMRAPRLMDVLERNQYEQPLRAVDASFIVEHLWKLHRGLMREAVDRVEVVSGNPELDREARLRLSIYVPALRGDETALLRLWQRHSLRKRGRGLDLDWDDACMAFAEALAFVRCRHEETIRQLVSLIGERISFQTKFTVMLKLGELGAVVGPSGADVVKSSIHDSSRSVKLARNAVVDRITSVDEDWQRCGRCSYGYLHSGSFHKFCSGCRGIGYVRVVREDSGSHDT